MTLNWRRKKQIRDEWSNFYQQTMPRRTMPPRASYRKKPGGTLRITAVLIVLAVLLVVRSFPGTGGEQVRDSLRYLLTAQWNFQPVLGKTIELAAQLVNWDNQLVQGAPLGERQTTPVTGTKLEQTALSVPVSGQVVSSFGWVKSPVDDLERFNPGITISAPANAAVVASLAGRVVKIDQDPQLGQFILIDHGQQKFTLYGGVEQLNVVEGQAVQQGEIIAKISKNKIAGTANPGLHFELRENGQLVDPLEHLQLNKN